MAGSPRTRPPTSRPPTADVSAVGALGPLPAPPLVRSSCGSPNLMAATRRLSRLAPRDNVRVALVARNPRDYIPERTAVAVRSPGPGAPRFHLFERYGAGA